MDNPNIIDIQDIDDNIDICSICLNTLNHNLVKTKCNHIFHKECINNWLNVSIIKNCAYCRTDLKNEYYQEKPNINIPFNMFPEDRNPSGTVNWNRIYL